MSDDDRDNFKSEEEFIDAFNRGEEFCFEYGGKSYNIFPIEGGFGIYFPYVKEPIGFYATSAALLEHKIDGRRLGDLLDDMVVTDRPLRW
jgi:hypothetical protein